MKLVLDASVALKWFFQTAGDEGHSEQALAVLEGIGSGQFKVIQPPHFLTEVAAVLARKKPNDAQADLIDLQQLEWEVLDNPLAYETAIRLSIKLGHHLFDTLYHATALTVPDALLVTADESYYRKAREHGQVSLLWEFEGQG